MKIGREHMTTVDLALENRVGRTHPGQADFVEPRSRLSCGACGHFRPQARNDQKGRCQKAANLAMKSLFSMPTFPAAATSCKFFEASEEPD
jgi:hypothetical protein